MDNLLTARQVQEILKVDRITVYRMLQDGRLKATKIGQQWRFARSEVERLISGENRPVLSPAATESSLPIHCIQTVQNLFSDVSQLSALVVDMQGAPLTAASHPCSYCRLIQSCASGMQACQTSWRNFARQSLGGAIRFTCHAGIDYVGAPIQSEGKQVALFLIGQFNWHAPTAAAAEKRDLDLAMTHLLSPDELKRAVQTVPVVPSRQHKQVEGWAPAAANAIHSILQERTGFIDRLQQIANLTQI
jgi:excisionase family DNA binding protein